MNNEHSYEKSPVYEFGIGVRGEVHLEGMTFPQAVQWIKGWKEICTEDSGKAHIFYPIRRPVGEWKRFV